MGLKRIPVPAQIELSEQGRSLLLVWPGGVEQQLPAVNLRRSCGCAHCVDEMTGAALLNPESVPEDLLVTAARPVGRYGVQLTFSDHHGTGIYTFEALHALLDAGGDQSSQERR